MSMAAIRVQRVVQVPADRIKVGRIVTVEKVTVTVGRKVNLRADVRRGLRMADLAVTETIVRGRHVAKVVLTDRREKKGDLTEIGDQLAPKAKAVPNAVKLL